MTRSEKLNQVLDAHSTYVEAARCLCEDVALALPVGTRVIVTLGRSRIDGTVTATSDAWWSRPGVVTIVNRKTGKRRRFEPWDRSLDLVVVDSPQAEDAEARA